MLRNGVVDRKILSQSTLVRVETGLSQDSFSPHTIAYTAQKYPSSQSLNTCHVYWALLGTRKTKKKPKLCSLSAWNLKHVPYVFKLQLCSTHLHNSERDRSEFFIRKINRTEFSIPIPQYPPLIYSYIHFQGSFYRPQLNRVNSAVPNLLIVRVGGRGLKNLRNRCRR